MIPRRAKQLHHGPWKSRQMPCSTLKKAMCAGHILGLQRVAAAFPRPMENLSTVTQQCLPPMCLPARFRSTPSGCEVRRSSILSYSLFMQSVGVIGLCRVHAVLFLMRGARGQTNEAVNSHVRIRSTYNALLHESLHRTSTSRTTHVQG
jgi:hypothetical protein